MNLFGIITDTVGLTQLRQEDLNRLFSKSIYIRKVFILIANTFAKAKSAVTDGLEHFAQAFAVAPLATARV